MQVRGYEVDYLYLNSIGIDNIADALLKMDRKELRQRIDKFIKDNSIQVLKYKGEHQWGCEVYDNLLDLKKLLDDNYITKKYQIKTELTQKQLDYLLESRVITKKNERYQWTGSKNYQAITQNLLDKL